MIAMDVPEDIRKQAQDIVQQLGTDTPRGLMAHAIAQALLFERLAQRERDAKIAEDFNWMLPMFADMGINSATDDAACMVQEQIAAAIRQS